MENQLGKLMLKFFQGQTTDKRERDFMKLEMNRLQTMTDKVSDWVNNVSAPTFNTINVTNINVTGGGLMYGVVKDNNTGAYKNYTSGNAVNYLGLADGTVTGNQFIVNFEDVSDWAESPYPDAGIRILQAGTYEITAIVASRWTATNGGSSTLYIENPDEDINYYEVTQEVPAKGSNIYSLIWDTRLSTSCYLPANSGITLTVIKTINLPIQPTDKVEIFVKSIIIKRL